MLFNTTEADFLNRMSLMSDDGKKKLYDGISLEAAEIIAALFNKHPAITNFLAKKREEAAASQQNQ
jgi:hypothetical protein